MITEAGLKLRPATVADAKAFLMLVNAFADYDKMPRLDDAAQQRLLHDAFEKKRFDIILAEWDGKPVGYAVILETYSTFQARPTLFMDDLFVLPEYRGKHVGYDLFLYCIKEAKRRECGRMEWLVLDWNHPALGFYDHVGAKQLKDWVPFRLNKDDIERMG